MITAVRWVPVGAAKAVPVREELGNDDHEEEEQGEEPQRGEVDEEEAGEEGAEGMEMEDDEPLLRVGQDLEFEDNADDPYIGEYQSDSDEDVNLGEGDQLIVTAHSEEEQATLSVYLYNDAKEQLYVHHDMMLPDMPLALEWIGASPLSREAGNWCAAATLSPEIELWNLDVLNPTNPPATLAGEDRKKKKKDTTLGGHSDAVLGLSWNRAQANVLASCSADSTVRLWDLNEQKCSAVFANLHHAKIQSVVWSPAAATVLATGAFDRSARVCDVRAVDKAATVKLESDAECIRWVPGSATRLVVASEDGSVRMVDLTRLDKGPVWMAKAHDKACTGLAMSASLPGLLITVSLDKSLKIWNVAQDKPVLLVARKNQFGPGALFGVEISEATPFVCCIACEGENLQVFDFRTALEQAGWKK